jgi:hypothetical protein
LILSAAFAELARAAAAEGARSGANARVAVQAGSTPREIHTAARSTARRCDDSQTRRDPK